MEDITQLCIEYDKTYGTYPETRYQGKDVLEFIIKKTFGMIYLERSYQIELNKRYQKEVDGD